MREEEIKIIKKRKKKTQVNKRQEYNRKINEPVRSASRESSQVSGLLSWVLLGQVWTQGNKNNKKKTKRERQCVRCSENPTCSVFLYTARCLPLSGGQKARGLSEERERGRMPGYRLSDISQGLSSFLRETD